MVTIECLCEQGCGAITCFRFEDLDRDRKRWSHLVEAEFRVPRRRLFARYEGVSMRNFAWASRSVLTAEDGPAAVEYAIMLAMIILVCFAAVMAVGTKTNSILQNAANSLP